MNDEQYSDRAKLDLIISILQSSPDNDKQAPLSLFNNLVAHEYTEFANSVSLKEEVEAFTKLQSLQNELARLYSLRDIANKSVVAIGGGFSAGKSQFVSSFFEYNTIELPIGINPVTAISTYIIHGDKHLIKGYTYKGGVADIPIELYKKFSHDFLKALGFNLKDILPMVAMETSIPEFTHICFVDTPGYNPSNIGTTSKDSNTAKEALENANALIWLVGLDTNGTIPKSDLEFLDSLELDDKKLYIVANKADLKPKTEIESILDHFEEVLDERGLDYEGISAYNSRKKEEITFRHKNLKDFIHSVDKDIVSKDKIAQDLYEIFRMYEKTLIAQKNEKDKTDTLLHSLELDIMKQNITANDSILDKIAQLRSTTHTKDIESSLQSLKNLRDSMFEALNAIFRDIFKSIFNANTLKTQELIDKGYRAYDNKDYKKAAQYFEEALKLGVNDNSDIYSKIGHSYYNIKDYTKATELYEKACELGLNDGNIYNNLGVIYLEGLGIKQDYIKAIEYFEKACELGNGDAHYFLGIMYHIGEGVQQDYTKATELYEKACKLGVNNTNIYNNLGALYYHGLGTQQDYTKAIEYFEKGCELDNGKAYYNLGFMYYNGEGVQQDYTKAIEYFEKAYELGVNNTNIYNNLGVLYYHGLGTQKDYTKAAQYFKKACKLGNGDACNFLGFMYHNAQGVQQDYIKAIEYFEKGCELGNGDAHYNLGSMYHNAQGIQQDYTKAKELYEKALELGVDNGNIYNNLGVLYLKGLGTQKDYTKAKEYFEKACELGNGDAHYFLGAMYATGNGVKEDEVKSIKYLEEACELGVGNSDAYLLLSGIYAEDDEAKAIEYLEKACELSIGNSFAYFMLMDYAKENDYIEYIEANKLFKEACDLGNGGACLALSVMYDEGIGVEEDEVKAEKYLFQAKKLLEKDCELGDGNACLALSVMYDDGIGVEEDEVKAKKYLFQAKKLFKKDCKLFMLIFIEIMESS